MRDGIALSGFEAGLRGGVAWCGLRFWGAGLLRPDDSTPTGMIMRVLGRAAGWGGVGALAWRGAAARGGGVAPPRRFHTERHAELPWSRVRELRYGVPCYDSP